MSNWYPHIARRIQRVLVHALDTFVGLAAVGHYHGVASAPNAQGYMGAQNMRVGAYTLANDTPDGDFARNFTVTHVAVGAADTTGTITVTGIDMEGNEQSETIIVGAGVTTAGTYAFKLIVSVEGAGWVIAEGNDTVTFGWGALIGLPYRSDRDRVFMATLDGSVDEIAAQSHDGVFIDTNTVRLTTALTGVEVDLYFIV
jgi:hypothetical protein